MSKVNATVVPIRAAILELWFGKHCILTPAPFALIVKYVSKLAHFGSMFRIFNREHATNATTRLQMDSIQAHGVSSSWDLAEVGL